MAADPSIGRVVVYRSKTGYDSPAIIAATQDSLAPHGVERFHETKGKRGMPPLASPDHVHLIVFSAGLPEFEDDPFAGYDEEARPNERRDANFGGTYREWNVPLWEQQVMHSPQPGIASQATQPDPGSWRWPVMR